MGQGASVSLTLAQRGSR